MAETIQRSFTGGEVGPSLTARVDQVKYQSGLRLCENFFPKVQGGIYSRPGFRFIDEVRYPEQRPWLVSFTFNTEQTYILVFEHLSLRFIRNGAYISVGGVPYTLTTPYLESQLSRIQVTQSADVLTIVHRDHPIKDLSRFAEDDWTLTDVDFTPTIQPPDFLTSSVVPITAVSTGAPPVVVTSIAHNLSEGDIVLITGVIGSVVNDKTYRISVLSSTSFSLDGQNFPPGDPGTGGQVSTGSAIAVGLGAGDFDKTYTYVVTSVDADGSESIGGAPVTITTKSLSSTAGVHLAWNAVVGADYYRIYKDPSNGTNIYGFIGESDTLVFEDFNVAPITSDAPPEPRDPLSSEGNYPGVVTYYQQRQVFANTYNETQSVYSTQTGQFNSLRTSIPARDSDAITFSIAGRQANEIRHLVSLDSLILFTSGSEWRVTEGQDQIISPSTVGVRVQSYNGASWVRPEVADDTVIYVQEKGSKIRDLKYSFSEDSYQGSDLSVFAQHLFEDYEVIQIAYSDEPYGILWVVRNDGVLLGLTYKREHQIWAWHQHKTQGFFESIAVISEDRRDALYAVVRRTINGETRRYVERLEPRDVSSASAAFCVDSGLSYSGIPVNQVGGLSHLRGEVVVCVADGNVYKDLLVDDSGVVTLLTEASVIHVGLPYICAMETLPIDGGDRPITSKEKSISEVTVLLEKTRGGFVQRIDDRGNYSQAFEIKPRNDYDNYDTLPLQLTDTRSTVTADGWDFCGRIRIEQRDPMPMAILAVIPDVDIGG